MARGELIAAAGALLLACTQPNPHGFRDGEALPGDDASGGTRAVDAPVPDDGPAAADLPALVPADVAPPVDATPPPLDAPPPPRDSAPADAAVIADVAPPADTSPDLPPAPEETCQGAARGCSADQTSTRLCEAGRWVFEQTCTDGTSCSAGACVCRAGMCQESVVLRLASYIFTTAVGGELLHYHKSNPDTETSGLHAVDLRTNEASITLPDGRENNIGDLAADSTGGLIWCRGLVEGQSEPALLRGPQVLEAIECNDLTVTDTHIYFTLAGGGLFRRPLDRPDRQTILGPAAAGLRGRRLPPVFLRLRRRRQPGDDFRAPGVPGRRAARAARAGGARAQPR